MNIRVCFLSSLFVALCAYSVPGMAQHVAAPSVISYQGKLSQPDGQAVADGGYSIRFSLWTQQAGGVERWNQTQTVQTSSGVFTALLDVASPPDLFKENLWMEVKVGADAPLPRLRIVSVPYALKANSVADNSVGASQIQDGAITPSKLSSGATGWGLAGNAGTTPNTNFVGTTDAEALALKANGRRVLQLEDVAGPIDAYHTVNTLGGAASNQIDPGVIGATISGGGQQGDGANDKPNNIRGNFGVIGGGTGNYIGFQPYATIAGGTTNYANGNVSSVLGGYDNNASGYGSSIGGGITNWTPGPYSVVPGGYLNTAYGEASFAAGRRAYAQHEGSFVWADDHDEDFVSTAPNQFCIRATGGVCFETYGNVPLYTGLGGGEANRYFLLLNSFLAPSASGLKAGGILCADQFDYGYPGKNDMVIKGSVGIGYGFAPTNYKLAVNGTVYALNGFSTSDERLKKDIHTLPDALGLVEKLRGVSFRWRKDEFPSRNLPDGQQVGLVAQEVEKALPEAVDSDGAGYKAVSYQSVIPVLVEAIKEQEKTIESLQARLSEMDKLKAEIAELEEREAGKR